MARVSRAEGLYELLAHVRRYVLSILDGPGSGEVSLRVPVSSSMRPSRASLFSLRVFWSWAKTSTPHYSPEVGFFHHSKGECLVHRQEVSVSVHQGSLPPP